MKIEKAYSLETGETLDAELAYDFYWSGKITNKKYFECPAENCTASITCANLDKTRQDMKVDPYFRTVGEHESDCDLIKNISIKNKDSDLVDGVQDSRSTKNDCIPDVFELSRPESHFDREAKNSVATNNSITTNRKKNKSQKIIFEQQPSKHYSLRAFVSKYLRYEARGLLDARHICIRKYTISYREMFVRIGEQDLDSLSSYPRVYFGKVFLNRRRETDYSANFDEKLVYDGKLLRPSTYIAASSIQNGFTKRLSLKKFEELSDKKYPSAWIFVYGIPKIRIVGEITYINIDMLKNNLDYFDMREKIDG